MQRIRLPRTDLEASRLGFGTASLHHILGDTARQALLASALDAGFTHFDTARMYGEGLAERSLGRFLGGGLRRRVTLASKFGLPAVRLFENLPALMYAQRAVGGVARRLGLQAGGERTRALSPAESEASLARSLKALRTDWLDILFVHAPVTGDMAALSELAPWLLGQKARGTVRHLGLSGAADACVQVARQVPGVFDVLQVEDSLAGREADVLDQADWPLQITFGYLRAAGRHQVGLTGPQPALAVLRDALARNRDGMVLVSTRSAARVRSLAQVAGEGTAAC